MAFIIDAALDAALSYISTNGNRIDICSQEPTTYAQATSTYTLGNDTSITFSAISDRTGGGRKITVSGILDSVTAGSAATASHFAITNVSGSALLVTGAFTSSQTVSPSNTFAINNLEIGIPDAV